jgi:hypothetical protein
MDELQTTLSAEKLRKSSASNAGNRAMANALLENEVKRAKYVIFCRRFVQFIHFYGQFVTTCPRSNTADLPFKCEAGTLLACVRLSAIRMYACLSTRGTCCLL